MVNVILEEDVLVYNSVSKSRAQNYVYKRNNPMLLFRWCLCLVRIEIY
jgi:hypothetical protein